MASSNIPRDGERRRHRRMPVLLAGRYMLPDRSEHKCHTIDISPGACISNARQRRNRATASLQIGFQMALSTTTSKLEAFVNNPIISISAT